MLRSLANAYVCFRHMIEFEMLSLLCATLVKISVGI